MTGWDVFVSHCGGDEGVAARLSSALRAAGLRVYRAVDDIEPFTTISPTVLAALRNSRLVLAYYSREYATRRACQLELTEAFLAGQAEGDPLRRVLVINPEHTDDHIQPRQLRDGLLPGRPASEQAIASLTARIRAVSAELTGSIGSGGDVRPQWIVEQPLPPVSECLGRWQVLWQLHTILHPHAQPLTASPRTPIAVLHGPLGVGKTTIAVEYARRFGGTFRRGVVWHDAAHSGATRTRPQGHECLWVLDNVTGEIGSVRQLLPTDPTTACLVVTRDARLSALGTGVAVTDLDDADAEQLVADRMGPASDPAAVRALSAAAAGSPGLRALLATTAAQDGHEPTLDRLYHPVSDLLEPLATALADAIAGEAERDVVRVLAAAAPLPVTSTQVADVLAAVDASDRITRLTGVRRAVTRLQAHGVLDGPPTSDRLRLPAAFAAAVRHHDLRPARAEQVRSATIRVLGAAPAASPSSPGPTTAGEEELRVANRVQTEVVNRVPMQPLPPGKGSVRGALTSLFELLRIVRTTKGTHHPHATRSWRTHRPGLGSIMDELMNPTLRTFLLDWDQELRAHEELCPPGVSGIDHERQWKYHDQLRDELDELRPLLHELAVELSAITGDTHGLDHE